MVGIVDGANPPEENLHQLHFMGTLSRFILPYQVGDGACPSATLECKMNFNQSAGTGLISYKPNCSVNGYESWGIRQVEISLNDLKGLQFIHV